MLDQVLYAGSPWDPSLFLIAAVIGFAAALPLGPISILTAQRSMTLGFRKAFWPTLGAVMADGLFGVVAAVGSGFLTSAILGSRFWLKLLGSVIILAMGAKLLTLRPAEKSQEGENFDPYHLAVLNFTLVLTNPLTLAFFVGAFTFVGLDTGHLLLRQSLVIGGGVIFGTLVWFVLLCAVAARFRTRMGELALSRVRFGVGGLFVLLGIFTMASVFMAG